MAGGDRLPPPTSPIQDGGRAAEVEQRVKEVLVGESVPPDTADRVVPEIIRVAASFWMAPLPPPDVLRGYEEVVPGAARTIIDAFAAEGPHRHKIERWQLVGQGAGLACGAIVALSMLGLAAYALALGYELVAAAIPTSMAGVAGVFVWRQRRRSASPGSETTRPLARGEHRNEERNRKRR